METELSRWTTAMSAKEPALLQLAEEAVILNLKIGDVLRSEIVDLGTRASYSSARARSSDGMTSSSGSIAGPASPWTADARSTTGGSSSPRSASASER
jgi:hypothetical protein